MNSSIRKIGFWSVASIVLSSQIGSGIFMLPASLAKFGGVGLISWIFTGVGAILLALIFAELSRKYSKTGGPHVFVQEAFGRDISFFIAWSYWIVSWVSTPAVIIAAIGYFGMLFGGFSPEMSLAFELGLLMIFTTINLLGIRTSGYAEIVFTILKIIPLILLPIACIPFLSLENFTTFNVSELPVSKALNAAAILTFWGFIGVECATTPAGSVENPNKTIPRAITLGTIMVALIYLISSSAVMSVVPLTTLQESKAPFAEAAKLVIGGNWYMLISLAAAIVCFGTLNAWILVSGQIALGGANDKLLPQFLNKQNRFGSPYIAILISAFGMVPLMLLGLSKSMVDQFTAIIDISVTAFLFIYIVCVLSYIKLIVFGGDGVKVSRLILGVMALSFCIWALLASDLRMVGLSLIIVLIGIPIYLIKRKSWV